ncbi:MAG: DUF5829 family protein [Isosphaeraceae bacterium]|nr:DUF5829 family protein [Isosphaeraceae bacterium]
MNTRSEMLARVLAIGFVLYVSATVLRRLDAGEGRSTAIETKSTSQSSEVMLNHFYIVLDGETIRDLRTSEFLLGEFASVDTGLPRFTPAGDMSEILYVRGRSTYMELMGPKNGFGEPVGKCGIGLTVESRGEISKVERALDRAFPGQAVSMLVDWSRDVDQPVHWYHLVHRVENAEHPNLFLWINEYHPDFFAWLDPTLDLSRLGITRARFLHPRFRPMRLLDDVVSLTVALPEPGRVALGKQLGALGYSLVSDAADRLAWRGRDIRFDLVPVTDQRSGIISIECRLTRRPEVAREFRFGPRSILRLRPDGTAAWSF